MITFWVHAVLIENPNEPDTNPYDCWWFYYKIVSGNNKVLLSSKAFPRLRNCVNAIKTIRQHMKSTHTHVRITKFANKIRKQKGEKLYRVTLL